MTITLVASILFGVALAGTLIVSLMLYYHWIRFGVGIVGVVTVMLVYAVGTAVLLLLALGIMSQL